LSISSRVFSQKPTEFLNVTSELDRGGVGTKRIRFEFFWEKTTSDQTVSLEPTSSDAFLFQLEKVNHICISQFARKSGLVKTFQQQRPKYPADFVELFKLLVGTVRANAIAMADRGPDDQAFSREDL
jgi:hypothetical protein